MYFSKILKQWYCDGHLHIATDTQRTSQVNLDILIDLKGVDILHANKYLTSSTKDLPVKQTFELNVICKYDS